MEWHFKNVILKDILKEGFLKEEILLKEGIFFKESEYRSI